jgi:hypothetical protein
MSMKKSFRDVGLPDGYKVLRLAYHQPSRTLVAHVGPIKDLPPGKRLYFRWATSEQYQPMGDCPAGTSVDGFVLDPSRPSLYFMTFAWKEMDGSRWAGDWDALYRFNLANHRCEQLTRRGELLPTEGYERVWLCETLSVSVDGRSLFCNVGLETPILENGGKRVDYWVTKLDLESLKLEAVTQLAALLA